MENKLNGLEWKFSRIEPVISNNPNRVEGYASVFGVADQSGDFVMSGAYARSLNRSESVKMLWQHDPYCPIGVWDEIYEDEKGLYVSGYLLPEVQKAKEAAILLKAGAIDGLSIGYRCLRSEKTKTGRALHEVELWEVSLVTFPMLPSARAMTRSKSSQYSALTQIFEEATEVLQSNTPKSVAKKRCFHAQI